MLILTRWLTSFGLLAATYNPPPSNYAVWASDMYRDMTSLVVLGGLLILIGYIVFLRATLRSIGILGMGLFIALFGTTLWVLWDLQVITFENPTTNIWLALLGLSLMLAVGMSWSHIRARLSGQFDMDDVDER